MSLHGDNLTIPADWEELRDGRESSLLFKSQDIHFNLTFASKC